jgi:uncharacterized protein YyaL (SSP411 family)
MTDQQKNEKKENENLLIYEKSPYLLQHAHNPVNWHPWGEEAFNIAKRENKPIFLSIGYSTCHWCHVMAHESFEDPEVGRMINELFIPIKVDREERPDIDGTYMAVCQMITGGGGWPLTIILTPEKKPFFAGTYFPKENRYGSVGLKEIIRKVRVLWENTPHEALESADKIVDVLEKISESPGGEELDSTILDETYQDLEESFDTENGGFGMIQKFPTPHNLYFLLRYWKRTQQKEALDIVIKTLDHMRNGGIYDHLGFGFHRYAVDPEWLVPHFEKMLYDQALIAMAYLESFQITGTEIYGRTSEEIFEYVLRDMQSPEGGFYSAEDADSEGKEGKFYLWTKTEIASVLDPFLGTEQAKIICQIFNISPEGNYKEESTGLKTRMNILHLTEPLEEISKKIGISMDELNETIDLARRELFNVREKRIRPQKDDKILTDWNGLMIAALARGSRVLGKKKYCEEAEKAADFVLENMCSHNRLLHSYRDGESRVPGNLDDYAFFIWGLLELYQTSFQLKYLEAAFALNESLMEHFSDPENGGFYFTADDAEKVLVRKKESYDSAMPSGNSVQMLNLLKMSQMSENYALRDKAINIERYFSEKIKRSPLAHTNLMNAIDFRLGPSLELVISFPCFDDSFQQEILEQSPEMIQLVAKTFSPNLTLILKSDQEIKWPFEVNESLNEKKSVDNKCTAYLCSDKDCKTPTTNAKDLLRLL